MWRQILLSAVCILLYVLIKLTDGRPNKLKYTFKFLWYHLYGVFVSLLLLPILLLKGRDVNSGTLCAKFYRVMSKFYGMEWQIENVEHVTVKSSAVIIANHQMSLDLLGIFQIWESVGRLVAIAKHELKYTVIYGIVCYLIGTEFVNRKNPKQSSQMLQNCIEKLKTDRIKIWIFPEGTRNKEKKVNVLPFKKGAFVMAIGAQVPIIPIVFSPFYFVNEEKNIFHHGGKMIMRCLPPVPTVGLTLDDVPELQERFHKIVSDAYEDLNEKVKNSLPSGYIFESKQNS